jgi:nitrogen-specific signal transduction histidine kinase
MNGSLQDGQWEGSVLADFDAGQLLHALSLGVIVLDAQLCATYANAVAESVLALRAENLRGRPFASFLSKPQRFLDAVSRALQREETVIFNLDSEFHSQPGSVLNVRVTPLRDRLARSYLLLEVRAEYVAELQQEV